MIFLHFLPTSAKKIWSINFLGACDDCFFFGFLIHFLGFHLTFSPFSPLFSSSSRKKVLKSNTILKLADHALFKMVRYVLLRPLKPELDGQLDELPQLFYFSSSLNPLLMASCFFATTSRLLEL
jgi:hypothetical protein